MISGPEKNFQRDRNLLFGVLAVQMRVVGPADLARAAALWATEPDKDLGQVLVDMGLIIPKARQVIEDMLNLQLDLHNHDASASLQAFGGNRTVHESFAASISVKDEGVESTLRFDDGKPDTPVGQLESFGGEIAPASRRRLGSAAGTAALPDSGPEVGERLDDAEHITLEHPGRYTIKHEHGRGGIGRVLVAFDEHMGRDIALKELIPEGNGKKTTRRSLSEAAARFLNEARITGRLEHPGIVPVHEIGRRVNESYYYTMKFVKGKTLGEKIKDCKNLEERLQLLPYYLNICQAAGYAHSQGSFTVI